LPDHFSTLRDWTQVFGVGYFVALVNQLMSIIEQTWLDLHLDAITQQVSKRDKAHPYQPGTGPKLETCGTCQKCSAVDYYYKCHVLMKFWTNGPGTDIRKKDLACRSWEPATEKLEVVITRNRAPRIDY